MKEFSYKEIGKKIGWNFSNLKTKVEKKSDFDYYKEVIKHIDKNTALLDIGCGSAEKSTRFFSNAKKIVLSDMEPEMLKKAKRNVDKYYNSLPKIKKKYNFAILDSRGTFKFKDNSFDLVVSRHCGANMSEVYRVLKKGGIFISEDVSSDDCQELKDQFGRGQGYLAKPLYFSVMQECLEAGFDEAKLLKFEEIEYYKTKEDLKFLLGHTPILNGFDEETDNQILQEYINKFSTKKGIKLVRKLYAFVLRK